MAVLFEKKITKAHSTKAILDAIEKLSTDKNERVLLQDHIQWLETKMKEIARLVRILKKRKG